MIGNNIKYTTKEMNIQQYVINVVRRLFLSMILIKWDGFVFKVIVEVSFYTASDFYI